MQKFGSGSTSQTAEWRMGLILAVGLSLTGLFTRPAAAQVASPTIDARILVISADGKEDALPAIQQALDYLGTPYTVYQATSTPGGLTPARLASGAHAFYQAVILPSGDLVYSPDGGKTFLNSLTNQEWQNLQSFEAAFGIRQVTWYTYPTADYGFGPVTASGQPGHAPLPGSARFTAAGQAIFSYINTANPLTLDPNSYLYLAQPLDSNTTPLLVDNSGNAVAAIKSYPDGRQNLALTVDSNQYMIHDLVLSYGLVNWVTRGLFLGQFHVYMDAQADDLFIDDDIFQKPGVSYRMNSTDLQALINWQKNFQSQAISSRFTLDYAFNGLGTVPGQYDPDTLTPAIAQNQGLFKWINHTYDHINLNNLNYADSTAEIVQNYQVASQEKFTRFSKKNIVTPEISGLNNPSFLQAAYDQGIRYMVSDSSVTGQNNNGNNPSPNAGFYNSFQPAILEIPRHPVNLFYNVSTPTEWINEYNFLYHSFFGKNLTYPQVLDQVSQDVLPYLLKGDIDPWMFHQSNTRAYDGVHSLLGDFLDTTLSRYSALYNLSLQNWTQDTLGALLARRMQYNTAGVSASFVPGKSITLRALVPCVVPVTGLKTRGSELYGGGYISSISLKAGQAVTLPLDGGSPSELAAGAPSAWQAVDLAVGSDNSSRVLWSNPDGELMVWSVDNTGHATYGPTYGPYPGWTVGSMAAGSDGITRLLWNNTNGQAALWLVGSNNTYQASYAYGPYAGWTAADTTVGKDNKARLLWTNSNGQMAVWTVDNSGGFTTSQGFGPYNGWNATSISAGSDGSTWVLWNNTDGTAALFRLGQDNSYQASYAYGPYPGWRAVDLAVGSDNKARILWTNSDGSIILWSVDSQGTPTYGPVYGSYIGWTATSLSTGSDNSVRIGWTQADGTLAIWLAAADNTYQKSFGFGSP